MGRAVARSPTACSFASMGISRKAIAAAVAICALTPASASEVSAQLVPLHAATLSSEIAARIDNIASRVGDRFTKGDLLVSFACALQNAQLTHAQDAVT